MPEQYGVNPWCWTDRPLCYYVLRWEKTEDLSIAGARRYFGPSFKRQVVVERLSGQASGVALARRYELSPNLTVRRHKAYH